MGRGQGQTAQAAARLRKAATRTARSGQDLDDMFLSEDIADFVSGLDRWPSAPDWDSAGKQRLYLKMMRTGGPRKWAKRIGVPYEPEPEDAQRERVRVQLTSFMQDRAEWPDQEAFAAAGKQRLHALMLKAGGEDLWAKIFGFPTRDEFELLTLMGEMDGHRRARYPA